MPDSTGKRGRPFNDHRRTTEAMIYRYRVGIPWRDLPEHFGSWKSVWKRHRRFSNDGTWDKILAALLSTADTRGLINWEVSVDSTINRAHQHATNLPRHTGGSSSYKNLLTEPEDHAIGRSRGGLSTKIHALVDGNRRPLVLLLGPGQSGDAPMFQNLLDSLKVQKPGPGAARKRPVRAMADKAYSSKAIRHYLRARGIQCVIPEREDQKANRLRRGSAGGRPVTYDKEAYKRRNVVECSFNTLKQWRSLATRYDKLALTYRAAVVLQAVVVWSAVLTK
ncbi:IS5 family transposase [Glutamicibacter creatinolyticus]|uniref:IS5 family transposase n=1 Tax=Glutamicibacter creatinolyticus TaxID=162496 RepID=UPI001C30E26A|nr:IS5 family transposase [Glutamicibacter creatinolyticus]